VADETQNPISENPRSSAADHRPSAAKPAGLRENNHGQNNQEFLDFLNLATAQIRTLLEKQPRIRTTSTKKQAAVGCQLPRAVVRQRAGQ
jgi:hypothetical protein